MSEKNEEQLDQIFSVLANKRRRQIVHMLGLSPSSISSLAEQLGMSLPAIHRHIGLLEESGLVVRKKKGRVNFLALNYGSIKLLQQWAAQYHTYWSSPYQTLENYLSSETLAKDESKSN